MVAFNGYAAPPLGPVRFRPPAQVAPWHGVREALTLPPSCPQPRQRLAGWTQEFAESEDCLYLNVWTPSVDDHRRRPVIELFDGGGYSIGPPYDGAALTADPVDALTNVPAAGVPLLIGCHRDESAGAARPVRAPARAWPMP